MKGSTSPRLDVRTAPLLGFARPPPSGTKRRTRATGGLPRADHRLPRSQPGAGPGRGARRRRLALIRDAEIEHTPGAHRLTRSSAPPGSIPATVQLYIVEDREPERLRRRRPEHLHQHRAADRARAARPAPRGDRPRARPHHRRPPDAPRPGAGRARGGIAAIGMLGAAAAAVGGAPGRPASPSPPAPSQAAQRSALAYSRTEEASADQAGLRYLAAAGSDPRRDARRPRPFPRPGRAARRLRRPLCAEPPALERPHRADRGPRRARCRRASRPGRGRLLVRPDGGEARRLPRSPAQTLRQYPASDASEAAHLARAVAWHRRPDPAKAARGDRRADRARGRTIPTITSSRASSCSKPARPPPRPTAYRQAVALAPKEPLILGGLGRALLNMDDDSDDRRGARRRWRARSPPTRPTATCCATSRSPRRGSATRAPRRSPPPSASRSRAASATQTATPSAPRRSCRKARRAGGGRRI